MGATARAFYLLDPPHVNPLSCSTEGTSETFISGMEGDSFTIDCPPKCSFADSPVYGDG